MIRRAQIADLPQLAQLFDDYRVFYRKDADLNGASDFIKERMMAEESIIFIDETQGVITGFTQLYPVFSSTRMSKMWLLNDLFIKPQFRGRGISKELIEATKSLCRETGAAGLLLETEKANIVGNQLYPSVGFDLYNETNFYWWENKA